MQRSLRFMLVATAVLGGVTVAHAPLAEAGVYISGSYSTAITDVPFEKSTTQSGSASVDVDIFSFLRIGVSYGLEASTSVSYRMLAAPAPAPGAAATPTPATASCATSACTKLTTISKVQERGAGITLILWPGDIMPYITVGAVIKRYEFKIQQGDAVSLIPGSETKPLPSLGAGVGLRLTKNFSLRFSVQASPGLEQMPGEPSPQVIWDKKSTFSLSYQI